MLIISFPSDASRISRTPHVPVSDVLITIVVLDYSLLVLNFSSLPQLFALAHNTQASSNLNESDPFYIFIFLSK